MIVKIGDFVRENELRNVQQIGKDGSFIITLPKKWCKANGISKGTKLEIGINHAGDKTLLISIPQTNKDQKTEIELHFSPLFEENTLPRAILQRYLDGYEIIKIIEVPATIEKKSEARDQIKRLVSKLYGCSLTETINQFNLQISSDLTSPHHSLQNLFDFSNKMLNDAIKSYVENDEKTALEIVELDDAVDKLYFHIIRSLKSLLRDPYTAINIINTEEFTLLDCLDIKMVATYLENLGDSAENIAKIVIAGETMTKISPLNVEELKSMISRITKYLENSFRHFRSNDYKKAVITLTEVRTLFPRIEKLRNTNIHIEVIRTLEEACETIIDICDLVGEYI